MLFRHIIIFLGTLVSYETYADMKSEFENIACENLKSSASMYFNELLFSSCSDGGCPTARPPHLSVNNCAITEWGDKSFKIRFEYERIYSYKGIKTTISEKATSACYFNSSYEWQCLFETLDFGISRYYVVGGVYTYPEYLEQYQPRFNSAILAAIKEYDL